MSTYAVAAVGPDAPGEVAALAEALARLGGNLEDASMTRLRGTFAMTVVTSVPAEQADVVRALQEAGTGLHLSVWPVQEPASGAVAAVRPWRVVLHGSDRPGLVAGVARTVAAAGGNITDLTCRLVGGLYVMTLEVDVEDGEGLRRELDRTGTELGVQVHVEPAEEDVL